MVMKKAFLLFLIFLSTKSVYSISDKDRCQLKFKGESPQAKSNINGRNLVPMVIFSEINLEKDLQAIRNSREEPLLREQGFQASYYAGVDQAREFNRVWKYLKEVNADLRLTHIPYFSNQVEKTISEFEKGFRKQNRQNTSFLESRLKILEYIKKEARLKIKNQAVTYNWWANFNFKLVFLTSHLTQIITEVKDGDLEKTHRKHFADYVKIYEDVEEAIAFFAKIEHGTIKDNLERFMKLKMKFPEEIMFFSTDDFGIMAFNRMRSKAYFIGVSGKNQFVDGRQFSPYYFFSHDVNHAAAARKYTKYNSKKKEIAKKLNNISNKSDREKAELAFFLFHHEGIKASYIQNLFKELYETHPKAKGLDNPIETLKDRFTKEKKIEMLGHAVRDFLNRSDRSFRKQDVNEETLYGVLLPDHLQNVKTDEDQKQLKLFLDETADIFIKVFSDVLVH